VPAEPFLWQVLGDVLCAEAGAQFWLAAPSLAGIPAVAGQDRPDCCAEPGRVGGLVGLEEGEPPAGPAGAVDRLGQLRPDRLADCCGVPLEQLVGDQEQACGRAGIGGPGQRRR
jgi:hypothetical protein